MKKFLSSLSAFAILLMPMSPALAQASIPAGCETPGDCAALSPTLQEATLEADLNLLDDDGSNFIGLKAPATVGSDITFTLPGADGTNGQMLVTDAAGNLSWASSSAASMTGLSDTDTAGAAAGALLYFDGSDWIDLGLGTAGQMLSTNAGATAPEWTSASVGSFSGLSDTDTTGAAGGALMYFDGTDWIDLGAGTAGQMLTMNAGATAPEWAAAASGADDLGNHTATTNFDLGDNDIVDGGNAAVNNLELRDQGGNSIPWNVREDAGNALEFEYNSNIRAELSAGGALTLNDAFTFPTADGTANQMLVTDGSGALSWTSAAAGSLAGLSDVNTATTTTGNLLLADGTDFESVALSGDVTVIADGTTTIGDDTVDGTDIELTGEAAGSLAYSDGTDWVNLGVGTAGQKLAVNTAGDAPEWITDSTTSTNLVRYAAYSDVDDTNVSNNEFLQQDIMLGSETPSIDTHSVTFSNVVPYNPSIPVDGVYQVIYNLSATYQDADEAFAYALELDGNTVDLQNASISNDHNGAGTQHLSVQYTGPLTTSSTLGLKALGLGASSNITIRDVSLSLVQLPTTAGVGTGGDASDFEGLTDTDVIGAAAGALNYFDGTDWIDLGVGTAGQKLAMNTAGDAPEWVTDSTTTTDLSYFYSTTITGSLNTTTPSLVVAGTDAGSGITNNGDGSFTINTAGRYELDANFSNNGSPSGNLNAFWANGIGGPQVGSRASAAHDSPSANTTTGGGNAHAIVDATAGQIFWIDSLSNVTFGGVYITIKQLPTTAGVGVGGGGSADLDGLTDTDVTGAAAGATVYFDGTDWVDLGAGTAGQALVMNASGTAPEWASGAPTEDVEVVEYAKTGALIFGPTYALDNARTWQNLVDDYEYVRFNYSVKVTGVTERVLRTVTVPTDGLNDNSRFRFEYGAALVDLNPGALTAGDYVFSGSTVDDIALEIVGVKAQQTVINPLDVAVNDQTGAASGYMDIGDMRIQWGQATYTGAQMSVTMPASFANNTYSVVAQTNYDPGGAATTGGARLPFSTNSFEVFFTYSNFTGTSNPTGQPFSWQAIGLKP